MKKIFNKLIETFKLSDLKCFLKDYMESRSRLRSLSAIYNTTTFVKVRISVKGHTFNEHIQMQSKKRNGIVNKTLFVTTLRPDINIVINSPNSYIPIKSNTGENWLIHIEPPGYINKLGYDINRKNARFTRIYTCDPNLYKKGGKYIASPPYVHWHLELKNKLKKGFGIQHDYDFLKAQKSLLKKIVTLQLLIQILIICQDTL